MKSAESSSLPGEIRFKGDESKSETVSTISRSTADRANRKSSKIFEFKFDEKHRHWRSVDLLGELCLVAITLGSSHFYFKTFELQKVWSFSVLYSVSEFGESLAHLQKKNRKTNRNKQNSLQVARELAEFGSFWAACDLGRLAEDLRLNFFLTNRLWSHSSLQSLDLRFTPMRPAAYSSTGR